MINKQTFYDLADIFDRFRIFPILMMLCYGYFVFDVFNWIKSLETISLEAAGIFSTVTGVAGFVFNFYTNLLSREVKNDK